MTVTSRVKEFENTPSAMLTLDQFNTVELDSEADPPVFTRNKFREVSPCCCCCCCRSILVAYFLAVSILIILTLDSLL